MKVDINNTFAKFSFNESLLTLPAQRTMTFCQDMDTSVVDDLGRDLVKITKIGVGLLILLAFLMILGNCFVQWWHWRCMMRNLERTRRAWASDPTVVQVASGPNQKPTLQMTDHNLLTLLSTQHHPLLTHWANLITKRLGLSHSQHNNLRFFFAYAFHMPALTCLLIGVLGILSVQLQLAAIGPIQAHYSKQVASSIGDFTSTIATNINTSMQNQSAEYVNGINSHSLSIQTSINDNVFGWVNGTTTTLNNTLVALYTDIQNAVTTVFGGTVLDSPAQEFVRCILGNKIEGLEKALTFLNDNLKVTVPTISPDALTLSNSSVAEITQPISTAAVGGGDGSNQGGLVGRLVNQYVAGLKKERLMFLIFLALWGLVAFMAICIILWHSYLSPWMDRRRRGQWKRERARTPPSNVIVPWYQRSSAPDRRRKSSGFFPAEKFDDYTGAQRKASPTPPPLANLATSSNSHSNLNSNSNDQLLPPPMHPLSRNRSQSGEIAEGSGKAGVGTWFGLGGKKKKDTPTLERPRTLNDVYRDRSPFPSEKLVVVNEPEHMPAKRSSGGAQSGGLLKGLAGLWKPAKSTERSAPGAVDDERPIEVEPTMFPDSPIDPRLTMLTPPPHIDRSSQLPPLTTMPPPPPVPSIPVRHFPIQDFPQSVESNSVLTTAPVNVENPLPLHHHFTNMAASPEATYSAPALARAVSITDPFASPIRDTHPTPPIPPLPSTGAGSPSNPFKTPPPPSRSTFSNLIGAPPTRNLTNTNSPTRTPPKAKANDTLENPFATPFDDRYRIAPFDDRYNPPPRRDSGRSNIVGGPFGTAF